MKQTAIGTSAPETALKENWEENLTKLPKKERPVKEDSGNELFVDAPLPGVPEPDYTRIKAIKEAKIFSRLSPEELKSLGDDIAENTLHNKLTLWTDPVIKEVFLADGRNRRKAMIKKGLTLTAEHFRYYTGTKDQLLAYVISENVQRRHISAIERTFICAEYFPLISANNRKKYSEKMKKIKAGEIDGDHDKPIDSYKESANQFHIKTANLKKVMKILGESDGEIIKEEILKGNRGLDKEYQRIMAPKRKLQRKKDLSSNLTKCPYDFTLAMFLKLRELLLYGLSATTAEKNIREFSSQHFSDIKKVEVEITFELFEEITNRCAETGDDFSEILNSFLRLTKLGIPGEVEHIEKQPNSLF